MQAPVEIAFRYCEPSEEIRSEIPAQVQRLEKFSPRITTCGVVVNGPQSRHRRGNLFQVEIRIGMPEHKDVVVDRRHNDAPEREHVLVAIREAFGAASRHMRGQVKEHTAESHGRVAKLLAADECGFIERPTAAKSIFTAMRCSMGPTAD